LAQYEWLEINDPNNLAHFQILPVRLSIFLVKAIIINLEMSVTWHHVTVLGATGRDCTVLTLFMNSQAMVKHYLSFFQLARSRCGVPLSMFFNITVNGRYGWTPEGGGGETTFDADYGLEFGGGRGYFFVAGEYFKQDVIDWSDRDRAVIESSFDYNTSKLCNENNTEDGDQCMRDITQDDWRERSDGTPGGVFEENSKYADGGWFFDENGMNTGWKEERDGINP